MRIIDRDLAFYESMIEGHARDIRECRHGEEPRHVDLRDAAATVRDAAATVRDALAHYQALIDAAKTD
jgi:hypothetical protein